MDALGLGVAGFELEAVADGAGVSCGSSSAGGAIVGAGTVTTGCGRGGLVAEEVAAAVGSAAGAVLVDDGRRSTSAPVARTASPSTPVTATAIATRAAARGSAVTGSDRTCGSSLRSAGRSAGNRIGATPSACSGECIGIVFVAVAAGASAGGAACSARVRVAASQSTGSSCPAVAASWGGASTNGLPTVGGGMPLTVVRGAGSGAGDTT